MPDFKRTQSINIFCYNFCYWSCFAVFRQTIYLTQKPKIIFFIKELVKNINFFSISKTYPEFFTARSDSNKVRNLFKFILSPFKFISISHCSLSVYKSSSILCIGLVNSDHAKLTDILNTLILYHIIHLL